MVMVSVRMPDDFGTVSGDILCLIEGLAEGEYADFAVVDGDGQTLGVKRLRGREGLEMNIAGYLRSLFRPAPVGHGRSGFVCDAGRSVKSSVKFNGSESESRVFAGAAHLLETGKLLSVKALNRSLSEGEYDELSFAVPDATVSAVVEVKGEVDFSFEAGYEAVKGIVTFRIDAADLAARATAAGTSFERCEQASVAVSMGGQEMTKVWYRLRRPVRGAVRLAWLNSMGAVDYHTFDTVEEESVRVSRKGYYGEQGYRPVSVGKEQLIEVARGYYPEAEIRALGEIVWSGFVWVVEQGCIRQANVLNDSVTLRSGSPECIRLRLAVADAV